MYNPRSDVGQQSDLPLWLKCRTDPHRYKELLGYLDRKYEYRDGDKAECNVRVQLSYPGAARFFWSV